VINKLEIYGIVLIVLALGFVGAYFKGRLDEKAAITQKQLADNAQKMTAYEGTLESRANADDAARQKALAFIAQVDQGLANVKSQFSKLPSVVVDARGCERLSPISGMRWNAVELLPAGPVANTAGSTPEAVPAAPVSPP
jgi:hypothetical protein